jgi:Ca2+/Na+ antiporter
LLYLFLGISIVADIFMEAIEVITSKVVIKELVDNEGNRFMIEVPFWNATIANLTLMALGSSAPEILLSVIETMGTLGQPAGELGPSTIVGSAAFNLLVISGVSILAVDAPKKINDMGVFATTGFFSMFAYIWLYICLDDNKITLGEAWWTLIFFFILCILAFAADKYNEYKSNKNQAAEDIEAKNKEDEMKIKKSKLRMIAKTYGELAVISTALGRASSNKVHIPDKDQKEIKELFKLVLDV